MFLIILNLYCKDIEILNEIKSARLSVPVDDCTMCTSHV